MDDPIILALVLAGAALAVAGLIGLNRLIGGWSPAALGDLEAAGTRLAEDVVGFEPGEGACAADGQAALVLEKGGERLGLVLARGDRTVTRVFRPGEVGAVAREGAALVFRFSDFTLPRARVIMADDAEAEAWRSKIARFARSS
jgi:hypothetical protein